MKSKLEIKKTTEGKKVRLDLSGRLDANWSGDLDEYIQSLARDGIYDITLNLDDVEYLSSAGIRILIAQYKSLTKIGGSFFLSSVSDNVENVLKMVGMLDMLTSKPETKKEEGKRPFKELAKLGYSFVQYETGNGMGSKVSFIGSPALMSDSSFKNGDETTVRFDRKQLALGIGAIGSGFEDCKNRYGEYISFGDIVTYMPTDGSRVPDYMISTGTLIPEINSLYSIISEGEFFGRVTFQPEEANRIINLSALIETLFEMNDTNRLTLLMIAESEGLIGANLLKPPVDGNTLFDFPEIRNGIQFTTEPAHIKKLTVSFGYFDKSPDNRMKEFVRPVSPESEIAGHIHTAVFPYQLLKKDLTDYDQTIRALFENSGILDILHLTNDSRPINGLGESGFKNGVCWLGK